MSQTKVEIGSATLYLGDCMDILPTLQKVDAVITDPPYGIDVGSMGMGKGKKATTFEKFEWDKATPTAYLIARCLAAADVAIIWGGNYFALPPSGCWLAWDKVQQFSGADLELAWTNLSKPTKAFRMSRVEAYGNIDKQHPTQKPLALMKWCIEQAGSPETILDPFMGSGTTGVAALKLNRKFIGIELDEGYFKIAQKRISEESTQARLFDIHAVPKEQSEGETHGKV